MSLVEVLVVIAAIGIIAAIALPTTSNIRKAAIRASATQNAKQVEQMSQALAALGVAHVIPDSMGGAAATARLFREGVIVPEGPMAGEKLILSGMRDSEIEEVARYLTTEYGATELRLVYEAPDDNTMINESTDMMLCLLAKPSSLLLGTLPLKVNPE